MESVLTKPWKEMKRRDINEEKRKGSVKKRRDVQRLRHGLFRKHFSTRITTRLLMGILLAQVPCPSHYLWQVLLLLHFGVQGQLSIFPQFNARCRLRPRQHLLYISQALLLVRPHVLLRHLVFRVRRLRDRVLPQTTRLSIPNAIRPRRCRSPHARSGWLPRKDGRDG